LSLFPDFGRHRVGKLIRFSAIDRRIGEASDAIELREERRARFMRVAEEVATAKLRERVGATMQVLVDAAPALGRKGGVGRSYADAPEIDGKVRLLPPDKASKTIKVGEFTRARVLAADGHDLVAMPI
jgi:ribosomal protein S12 methylthiotransferase